MKKSSFITTKQILLKEKCRILFNLLKIKWNTFLNSRSFALLRYFFDIAILVVVYGIIGSLIGSELFNFPFHGIKSILAWGFFFYLIKEEVPRIVRDSIPLSANK